MRFDRLLGHVRSAASSLRDRERSRGSDVIAPVLKPIIVAGSGRSGTTTMMQLLGTSTQVVFDRIYAYENAYLSYLLGLAAVPLRGIRKGGPWKRAAIDHETYVAKHGLVGGLPWPERPSLTTAQGEFEDELFRSMWEVFSRRAGVYGQSLDESNGSGPLYYAETAPVWVADRARTLLEGKTIYLARDPRDQWISIMAFNAKRGRLSFGMQPTDTPETFAAAFALRQKKFLERVLAVTESASDTVITFQDITAKRESTAARLSTWLGVQLSAAVDTDHRPDHTTATSTEHKPRWPTEMPAHILEIFRDQLQDEIQEMGWGWDTEAPSHAQNKGPS